MKNIFLLWILHIISITSTFIMWWGLFFFGLEFFMEVLITSIPFMCVKGILKKIYATKFFKISCALSIFIFLICFCQFSSPYQNLFYH